MTHPPSCKAPGNKTLYTVFWALLVIALSLSLSLSVLVTMILKPRLIHFSNRDSVIILIETDPFKPSSVLPHTDVSGNRLPEGK
jgi:hypothetical protein